MIKNDECNDNQNDKKWKNKYFKDFQCVAGSVLHKFRFFLFLDEQPWQKVVTFNSMLPTMWKQNWEKQYILFLTFSENIQKNKFWPIWPNLTFGQIWSNFYFSIFYYYVVYFFLFFCIETISKVKIWPQPFVKAAIQTAPNAYTLDSLWGLKVENLCPKWFLTNCVSYWNEFWGGMVWNTKFKNTYGCWTPWTKQNSKYFT